MTLFLIGLFVICAMFGLVTIGLVVMDYFRTWEREDLDRAWKEQVLRSCAKKKADKATRLTRALIGDPERKP